MGEHQRGLIMGPKESAAEFEARSLAASAQGDFPARLNALYGMRPDWVPITYTNKGLRFWEGGCSFSDHAQVMIQLRSPLKTRTHLWGLYAKEELLAHEGVHAARLAFDEPIFEEVLAYQTSTSRFRRYFGPFFRTPAETLLFVGTLALFPFFCYPFLACMLYGGLRLVRTQKRFRRARDQLVKLVGKEQALPLMLHLTDREILHFAKSGEAEILAYIGAQQEARWEQIRREFDVESCSQSRAQPDI